MKISIVGGLGFGDEGKGAVTDYLVRRDCAGLVVRYNGGNQAAHNVTAPDGRHHTFSQFGAGTLAGARTFLSKHMLVEPIALVAEACVLAGKGIDDPLSLINIDPACTVITRYHRYANRHRERLRGDQRHGSVGLGVGEARADELEGRVLKFGDLDNEEKALAILERIATHKREELPGCASMWEDPMYILRQLKGLNLESLQMPWELEAHDLDGPIVFEGAQGLLLDETLGFAPHNTWTDCTFGNAVSLLDEIGVDAGQAEKVGIIRSYHTRHGAGPFPTEDASLAPAVPEMNNKTETYMGSFRVGHFDISALDYAVWRSNINYIALTHCDRRPSKKVGRYGFIPIGDTTFMQNAVPEYLNVDDLPAWLTDVLRVPVGLTGNGPTADHYKPYQPREGRAK